MADPIQQILTAFPKKRIELPPDYKRIYAEHYKRNRQGETNMTSISSKMEQWLHTTVASDVKNNKTDPVTLEIGAGTLNHLKYEPAITRYDIIEPFQDLLDISKDWNRIRNHFRDISEIALRPQYDRIISIATFEHVTNLPEVVASSALLLHENGHLKVSIPNEGRLWWKLGTMITGAEFKRMYGLDYDILMRHEHVNNALEIESVLQHFYKKIKRRSFGINKHWSFYLYFDCSDPDRQRANSYLDSIKTKK